MMEQEEGKNKKPEFRVAWKPLTDESEMPWGAHKGKKMANVPADYLVWLHDNQKCSGAVLAYIVDNMDVLKVEANKLSREKGKSDWAIDRPGNARDLRERRVPYKGRKL